MKDTRVCLLGANFSTGNLGVSALAYSALQMVFSQQSEPDVLILDYHRTLPEYDLAWKGRSVPVLNMSFSKRFGLRNHIVRLLVTAFLIRFIPFPKLRQRAVKRNAILSRLSTVDLFAAVSGGDSFSDIYGLLRFFYMSFPQILVILLGKPLVQLPQTYGPFKSGIARMTARFILRRSQLIYSRDYEGVADAKAILGDASDERVRFCYDLAFAMSPEKVQGAFESFRSRHGNVIGLNVSGLLYKETERNPFGLKSDYVGTVKQLINWMIEELGSAVMLVPHVYGSGKASQSDLDACRMLYAELGRTYGDRLYLLDDRYDQNQIKYVIGRCDFFAGSRMHSCIAALSQSVPAAGLAYSQKFAGVFSTIGMESTVIDLRTLDTAETREAFRRVYENRENLKNFLKSKNIAIGEKLTTEIRNIFETSECRC